MENDNSLLRLASIKKIGIHIGYIEITLQKINLSQ